jgi:putative redox protein
MLAAMSRMRSAVLVHEGGNRFVAQTGTNRTIVFGDDKEANEYSPVETIAAALAACSAMDVVSILGKKRQVLTSYRIEVTGNQRDEYPQIYTRLDVTHVLEGTVLLEAAVRRAIELSAKKYCPVNAMVSAGATEVHHRYSMRCTGAVPHEGEGEVTVTGPERRPDIVA